MVPDPRVFEYCETPPPFLPGTSPFHIKGQFYIQAMRALSRLERPLDGLLPEDLKAFCAQEFLASQWYDVLPFPRLAMIEAAARACDVRDLTRRQAHRAAEHGLRGVYRFFLPLVLPQDFALRSLGARMVSAIKQFYDFGPAAVIEPSDSHTLTIERRDVPLCMIEWWSINASGYAEKALALCGVKELTLSYRYEESGVAHALRVGRVVISISRAS
jgi:hypothetical protein